MTLSTNPKIIYPDSDGQPMADNTQQFRWVEEYYIYDPDRNDLHGLQRQEGKLTVIEEMKCKLVIGYLSFVICCLFVANRCLPKLTTLNSKNGS